LASSLREILTKNASSLSFEELYRNGYKLVLMSRGDDLYERVQAIVREWLECNVLKDIRTSVSPGLLLETTSADALDQSNEKRAAGEKFLTGLKEAWEDHHVCMGMITDVLMYMVCFLYLTPRQHL
jgi:cullin 3